MRCVRPLLDGLPLGAGDDARQQVVREDALGAFVAAVNGEGDALVQKRHIGGLFLAPHFFGRQPEQQLIQRAIVLARMALGIEHFVESAVEIRSLKTDRKRCAVRRIQGSPWCSLIA